MHREFLIILLLSFGIYLGRSGRGEILVSQLTPPSIPCNSTSFQLLLNLPVCNVYLTLLQH